MSLLIDSAMKATLVLGAAAGIAYALRRAAAGIRCLVWSVALVALLVLPAAAALLPAWQLAVLPAASSAQPLSRPAPADPDRTSALSPSEPVSPAGAVALDRGLLSARDDASTPAALPSRPRPDWSQLALAIWMTGALLLVAQLSAGLLRVAWIDRRAKPVHSGPLYERLQRVAAAAGVRSRVRLLESDRVAVPVTWRFRYPRILVPAGIHRWAPAAQRAVFVHELEHVRRLDSWMQLVARAAVALHWFNPLAWVALHRLHRDRELACDDAVLRAGARPSDYAQQLVELACAARRHGLPSAAVSMAASTRLRDRIQSILDPSTGRSSPNRRTVVTVASTTLIFLLPLAALQPVPGAAATTPSTLQEPGATVDSTTEVPPAGGGNALAGLSTSGAVAAASIAAQQPQPSLDDLVRMRIHGVSPEFIAEIASMFAEDLDVDTLVKLRIHGVSGDFARQMRAALGNLDLEQLVQARIHGVNPDFASGMSQELGADLDFDGLRKMRIHGVNAEYARAMRASLGAQLGVDELVTGRIHGISADFARRMSEMLGEELDFDTLKRMRIHGVSADWVQSLRDDGYTDLTAEELIDIKIHGMERVLRRRQRGQDR